VKQYKHIVNNQSTAGATLGRRIAACRVARGWTQKRLAEEAGISVPFLSDVENDKRSIGSDPLVRLADALGASLDYLLKGIESDAGPRGPLVIPGELAEAAEEQGWSVGEAQDLVNAHRIVVSRRSKGDGGGVDDTLSKQGWLDFYRRLFGRERA
jgi:transcriptional regulator with XRE-family HTH domain